MTHPNSQPDNALGVTAADWAFARQILDDCSVFEEGIEDEEKLAQWVRNVREAAVKRSGVLTVDELGGYIEHGLCYGISSKDGRTCARNLLLHFDITPKVASALSPAKGE